LVTSSMVAVRGLIRSLYGDFGFAMENVTVADTDLSMSGYRDDQIPAFQKRMIETVEAIPGVESVGLGDTVPLSDSATESIVYTDQTAELKPANAAATASIYNVSPEYLHASGTSLLAGRTFTWHDD